jgi:histone deacetylase 11
MTLGSKGSVEAAYLAMSRGWAINLSGGFHHASRDNGEGFCVIPDITFVTHFLRKNYGVKRILILDLDAHQGNGHERDHMGDEDTQIIDAYNHGVYPGDRYAKEAITYDIRVSRSTKDSQFLNDVDKALK